jgi:hemerythrin-like domain-containing protein
VAQLSLDFADLARELCEDSEMPRHRFDSAANRFIEQQRRYMEMEERMFFPAAVGALDDADWAAIEAEVDGRRDLLFGRGVEKRLAILRRNIIIWEDEDRTESS